jgi:hypothetical protein
MRYLKGTMSYGIRYTGHPNVLEGYCADADELYATRDMCSYLEVALFPESLASRLS